MLSTLTVVFPIFALILVGYLSRKIGVLGPLASSELNRFVVYLALPALLFDIMAHSTWSAINQPGFIVAFGASCAAVFALTLAVRLRPPRHIADASIDGLNAAYGNVGYIGLPLSLIALGKDSQAPAVIAAIFTACVLFAAAIILIEIGLQTEKRVAHLALKVARSLLRNPLLIAPLLGGAVAASGLGMPDSAETFFRLLGGSASPCALVALGLFLAGKRVELDGDAAAIAFLVLLKLVVQPAIAWVLADKAFELSPIAVKTAVLMSALPTGTGPFMLAEFYRREANITSNVILISTIGSLFTISAYLAFAH
jgi:malonate transporter and related proteins